MAAEGKDKLANLVESLGINGENSPVKIVEEPVKTSYKYR